MFQKRLKKNLTDNDITRIILRLIIQTILAMIILSIVQFFIHFDYLHYAFHTPHRKNTYPEIIILIEDLPYVYDIDTKKWNYKETISPSYENPNILFSTSDTHRNLYYDVNSGISFSTGKNVSYHLNSSGGLCTYKDPTGEFFATKEHRTFFEKDLKDFIGPLLEHYQNSNKGTPYGQFLFDLKFYDRFH